MNLCRRDLYCLLITLLCLSHALAVENSTVNSTTLHPHTGYYCYLRCFAKCIVDRKISSSDNDSCMDHCGVYRSNTLCESKDSACWSRCKDLTTGSGAAPNVPEGLTVAYSTLPHPTPHEADLNWKAVSNANLYIVQNIDKTDTVQKWTEYSGNLTIPNSWHFRKPDLCPEYGFRVAAVSAFGVSAFSRIVGLPTPEPIFDTPGYKVKSIELIHQPFHGLSPSDPTFNTTVQIIVEYTPPSNWDLDTEIVRVEPTFHIADSPMEIGQPVAPYIRAISGKPEFMILLPGDLAFTDKTTKAIFVVDRLYTKCNPARGVEYPNKDGVEDGGFMYIEFNCATVHGAICPGRSPIRPLCNFEYVKPTAECVNGSFANVTVTFSKPNKNNTVVHYIAAYGPIARQRDGSPVPTWVPWQNVTLLTIPANASTFSLQELLPIDRDFAASLCAIFDERAPLPDWNLTLRYPIALTEPDVVICSSKKAVNSMFAFIALPVAAALLVGFAVLTALYVRTRRHHAKTLAELEKHRLQDGTENGYVDLPRLYDRWEIPRSHLIVHEDRKLGSGAFGAVYKGKIRGRALMSKHTHSVLAEEWMKAEDCDVAVKMLPEYADEGAKSEFRKEINLMKQLGHHERLVNMVCCVTADEPLCLVVEYCSDGDLLHYLRDRCKYMVKLQEQGVDLACLREDHDVDLNYILSIKDLLMFSWQICVGLEYLSEKNYIHRDVAARNIMVDVGKRAKIGDFGLCRYSCSDPIYMGKGGRLPWKWMALEAIKSYEFTTKSDVWSFGVLLFEIVTLGGSPYPGIDPGTMEQYLEDGNRLAQPDNCPDDFYAIMTDCWNAYPEKRPTFTNLRERLSKQLEHITEDYSYLHLNQNRDYYNMLNQQYNSKPQYPGSLAPIVVDDDLDQGPSNESVSRAATAASVSFMNRAFDTHCTLQTPDFSRRAPVIKSSSYPTPNSLDRRPNGDNAVSGTSLDTLSMTSTDDGHGASNLHRDSGGSEQMLISSGNTLGIPKQEGPRVTKFFKLKPAQMFERLDTLPESNSAENRKDSAEVGSANPVYMDRLLISDLVPVDEEKPAAYSVNSTELASTK